MQDIHRARGDVLAGYQRSNRAKDDVSIQFYVWDRLVYEHFRRLTGRHLELVLNTVVMDPDSPNRIEVGPLSWLFPADTVMRGTKIRYALIASP